MGRSRARLFVGVLLLASSLGAPDHAWAEAQTQTPARELFKRGVKAVELGDLLGALAHFQEAYQQSPNQTVLFNIAQTQIALGQTVQGVATLRRYLEFDGTHPGNAQGRRVRELLAYTERRLGRIAIEMTPPDAALEIDGVPQTPDAAGTVEAAAGSRQLVLTKPGFQTVVQRVEVAAGQTASTVVELMPVPPPSPRQPLSALEPRPKVPRPRANQSSPALALSEDNATQKRRTWALVSGVSGALVAGGGIALLIRNQSRYRDFRRDHEAFSNELASGVSAPDHPARASSLQSTAAHIQRNDDIGVGMTVFGGMLLAVTGTLLAWDFDL